MPRVLRIINRFNLGGPTYNAAYLTKYLPDEFQTLLIGGQKDESEAASEYILDSLGVQYEILPEMRRSVDPSSDFKAYRKLRRRIKEFRPHIVHTHASKAGTLGRLAAYHENVPIVVHTFHGHVFHSYFSPLKTALYKNIERFLARRSSSIIAISEVQKHELCDIHRICPSEKIDVIPLGFDLDRFQQNQKSLRAEFRRSYELKDEIAIGIIGRLVPIKDHDTFLEAIRILSNKVETPFKAFIIGDGELRADLEQKASDLIQNGTVVFTSWIKNVELALAGLDVVALSSLNEGTPVSLIEAQAAGKPIVSTQVGGIENVVKVNESAFLCQKRDPESFAALLSQLVEHGELRQKMGDSGREDVMRSFSYHRLVNDVSNLYNRLINDNLG